MLYGSQANGWLTGHFARTGIDASTNGYFTSYGCDRASDLTNMASPSGTPAITNRLDALNRLTNRLDGLGPTRYAYAVLSHGLHTVTEDGPWAADEVTVTHRFGRRAGRRIARPTGAFVVTNAPDAAGRWAVVSSTAESRSRLGVLESRLPARWPVFLGLQDGGGVGAVGALGLTGSRPMPTWLSSP